MPNGVKNDWERLPKKPSKRKEFRSHQAKLLERLAKIVKPEVWTNLEHIFNK